MANFTDEASVQAWVNEHSVEALRYAIASGAIGGPGRAHAGAWLDRHDRRELEQERTAAAKATREATEAAKESARWTMVAALAALATAGVTAVVPWLEKLAK